jgi:hypothetical protein
MKSKTLSITGFLIMMCLSFSLAAQDIAKLRVAVLNPSVIGVDENTTIVARQKIGEIFTNTGKYTVVERSLLDEVMKELKFSHTDPVDESQAIQLGKLASAEKVVLLEVTRISNNLHLSIKLIDVKTATVEQHKTKEIGLEKYLGEIVPLTLTLLGENVRIVEFNFKGTKSKKNPTVRLYIDDDQFIGEGDLNTGFQLKYTDTRPGIHELRAEWSGVVPGKSYRINTAKRTHFDFEYKTTGFGYAFVLIK